MTDNTDNKANVTFDGPLAYAGATEATSPVTERANSTALRTHVRALTGMQKEAIVTSSANPTAWALVCDEGPYLNGTDLAPPPLAYFSAGMASCYVDALQAAAALAGTTLRDARLVQDNYYTMEGSAIRGTMIAGALPVRLLLSATFADSSANAGNIIRQAVGGSPIDALMRDELVDTFSIVHNGKQIPTGIVTASERKPAPNPLNNFPVVTQDSDGQAMPNIVSKIESTESVFEADHGAGAAMKDTQKRQLHIRSVLSLRADGIREIKVQIFKPIGSVFSILADASGSGRAPSGQVLVSAGVAFCFMTQIGRYAGIVKQDLAQYGIVQDATFDTGNGITLPIDTHAFVTSTEDQTAVQKFIDMAEATCFLHGACRTSNKTRLTIA